MWVVGVGGGGRWVPVMEVDDGWWMEDLDSGDGCGWLMEDVGVGDRCGYG